MEWTGYIMAKDTIVAAVDDGWVSVCDQQHCPYYFLKHSNRTGWLARRAIDTDCAHFRMLKNVLKRMHLGILQC